MRLTAHAGFGGRPPGKGPGSPNMNTGPRQAAHPTRKHTLTCAFAVRATRFGTHSAQGCSIGFPTLPCDHSGDKVGCRENALRCQRDAEGSSYRTRPGVGAGMKPADRAPPLRPGLHAGDWPSAHSSVDARLADEQDRRRGLNQLDDGISKGCSPCPPGLLGRIRWIRASDYIVCSQGRLLLGRWGLPGYAPLAVTAAGGVVMQKDVRHPAARSNKNGLYPSSIDSGRAAARLRRLDYSHTEQRVRRSRANRP